MKAIALVPGTTNVSLKEFDEPVINAPDEVKLKVLEVGICGTDREEVSGGRADAPPGHKELIIGHEMFGQVVETGGSVTKVKKGDYGVFMVRRGCGKCPACLNDRSDMCYTGDYTERGIKQRDGYQAQYVVDSDKYLVKLPDSIKEVGVLTEPMSVGAKAIDEALIIQQARLKGIVPDQDWIKGKRALIAGIGAIGLLAAFALKIKGAEVIGMDVVDENTLRPGLLKEIGGSYIDGRQVKPEDIDDKIGEVDLIFEATGIAKLQLQLLDALGINGVYVLTGIPSGNRPDTLLDSEIMRQMVLKNQVMVGSVNASITHFGMAVDYLEQSMKQWPDAIKKVITSKIPYANYDHALHDHSPDEIKVVVDWAGNS